MEPRKQLLDYLNNRTQGKEQAKQLLEEIDQAVTDCDSTPHLGKGEVSVSRTCSIEWELMPVNAAVVDAPQNNEEDEENEFDEDLENPSKDDETMSHTLGLRLWRPQDAAEPQLSITVWASGPTTPSDWKEIKRLQTLLGGALHRYRYGEEWDEDLLELKRLPLSSVEMSALVMDIVKYARRMRSAE